MATINKPKKKTRYKINNKAKDIYDNVYNTTTWKNLRQSKLLENPLCECCNEKLAVQVHHRQAISTSQNEEEMIKLGFDYNNLMSVCEECHLLLHGKKSSKTIKN